MPVNARWIPKSLCNSKTHIFPSVLSRVLTSISTVGVLGRGSINLFEKPHTSNCRARNQDRNHGTSVCHVLMTQFKPQVLLFFSGSHSDALLLPAVKL
jgi:hypothetical protein